MSIGQKTATLAGQHAESAGGIKDYWELTKPRLSLMAVATAILGYFAAGPQTDYGLFAMLVAGTSLSAFGAAVLNQWMEREADARMGRTRSRPVAAGRVSAPVALAYGLGLSAVGVAALGYGVNALAAGLSALTVVLYIGAYTPLKRIHPLATEVGAIPGAVPPLIGWAAAGNGLEPMAWILFGVLVAWQLPHFMAIAWTYREDYRAGGFQVLSVRDASGAKVARRALAWTLALIVVSLLPVLEPGIDWLLAAVALLLGCMLLEPAWRFVRAGAQREPAARKLFLATLVYLPVYLSALVVDRFIL